MGKRILAIMLCAVMLCAIGVTAHAEEFDPAEHAAKQPDYSRNGSVTVEVLTADGEHVPGGKLQMFQVALAKEDDGNNFFEFTPEFEGCGQDLTTLDDPATEAKALADWAKDHSLTPTELEIDSTGKVVFPDLKLGLYLFVQETPAKGYSALNPFIVTVPLWDGEKLVYDVLANPKPGTTTGLGCLDLKLTKVIKVIRGTPPKNQIFTFKLTPLKKGQPMPENEQAVIDAATGAMSISRTDAGEVILGEIWFGLEDIGKTYEYTLQEIAGSTAYFTYDTTVYDIKVTVKQEKAGDALTLDVVCKDGKGNTVSVKSLIFTNVYDNTNKLPQTGQLWWPVSLLAGLGMLLFLSGWLIKRQKADRG